MALMVPWVLVVQFDQLALLGQLDLFLLGRLYHLVILRALLRLEALLDQEARLALWIPEARMDPKVLRVLLVLDVLVFLGCHLVLMDPLDRLVQLDRSDLLVPVVLLDRSVLGDRIPLFVQLLQ